MESPGDSKPNQGFHSTCCGSGWTEIIERDKINNEEKKKKIHVDKITKMK